MIASVNATLPLMPTIQIDGCISFCRMAGANEDEEVRKRFRNAHALFASEVYHVIENHIHKREVWKQISRGMP